MSLLKVHEFSWKNAKPVSNFPWLFQIESAKLLLKAINMEALHDTDRDDELGWNELYGLKPNDCNSV
jgi:hypothetical protein